ncbi:MAG: N-6 DNA methylase, partial [Prevotellaceae bacterium]|nr:N-6 DNA methylase [Prevotellaceae bacterium]
VGKVGCYLHGDGLARVIHSDGLGNFLQTKEYQGFLQKTDKDFPQENRQFDILVSNPPYSVSAFKNNASKFYGKNDFELYENLTDNSSEIECLFVERTKQLLKDGGVAGVILPKSILEKGGIYTKAREIILQNFEIVAITELGSNTFMATGTNTVVLFLRRRNNYDSINLKKSIDSFFENYQNVTLNGTEKPFSKYVAYVWENISFDDYITLLKKEPNKTVENHDIYKEYRRKIKAKTEKDFWNTLIETEKEKLLYFILAYPQKVVLVKTGEKDEEKHFLGYKFSDRRETQGIFPMQTGKTIDECTQLFDAERFDNPEKASTYIYKAFAGNYDLTINENLRNNVTCHNLIQLFTFNNADFEKDISLTFKERIEYISKWNKKRLRDIFIKIESGKRPKGGVAQYRSGVPSLGGEHIGIDGKMNYAKMKFVPEEYFNSAQQGLLEDFDILLCKDGALTGKVALFKKSEFPFNKGMINEHVFALKTDNDVLQKYVFYVLYSLQGQKLLRANVTGTAQGGLNRNNLENIQIPLPLKEIQEKIVFEIETLEEKAKTVVITDFDGEIEKILKKYLQ